MSFECSASEATAVLRTEQNLQCHLNAASQRQQLYLGRTDSTVSIECSASEATAVLRTEQNPQCQLNAAPQSAIEIRIRSVNLLCDRPAGSLSFVVLFRSSIS